MIQTWQIHRDQKSGFTLIELLVVIAIISILAGLLLVNMVGVRGRAEDTKKKNDLRQLKTAMRLYYNDYQRYPQAAGANLAFAGCGGGADPTLHSSCGNAGGAWTAGTPAATYISQIPLGIRYYAPAAPANAFLLRVDLENASDADIAASQQRCCGAEVGSTCTNRTSYYTGGVLQANQYFVCED